jgi:hypothetical protein
MSGWRDARVRIQAAGSQLAFQGGTKPMRTHIFSAGLALALLALPALAQAPQGTPARIRGTVEKLDGNMLTVKSRDGTDVAMEMTDKSAVRTLVKKSLSDIKPGDFVASTGRPGPGGKLHAVEVRIFPEAWPRAKP